MKNKSLFAKILKYFLTTLILPFCTIFLLYGYAENTVKEQTVLSGERALMQFFAMLDNTMEDIRQICISVGNEEICNSYIKNYLQEPDGNRYQEIEIYNCLRSNMGDNIYDILVYYPAADRIVSARNGSLTTDRYLMTSFGRGSYDTSRYDALLKCDSKKPRISTFTGLDQQTYLSMNMQRTSVGDPQRNYVVSVVLSPKFLSSTMMQEYLGDEGTLMIFDSQKNLLISGDGTTSYDLKNYDGTGKLLEIETENGKFMMLVEPSQAVSGFYAYAMDVEIFWRTLSDLRLVCLIACLICLALTVVLVVRSTKHVYHPIGTLVQRAEQSSVISYDAKEHNEIQFIEKILDISRAERIDLQKQAKKSRNIQCDQFVQSLLRGKYKYKESEKEILEQHGLPMFTNQYRVVLIFVEKRKDIDVDTQDFVIHNVFEEVARANGFGYVVELAENQYALLINLGQNADAEEEMGNLRGCQDYISRELGLELTMASGRIHHGLADISKSFEEAEIAMKYKYLMGEVNFIDYQNIKNREFSYISSMESNLSRSIVGYINGKNPELSAEEFVANVMEMCNINSETSMDNMECFKYEIISIVNKVFMICGIYDNRKEQIQELVMQPTLEQFRTELAKLLDKLRGMKMHRSRHETVCQKAVEFILEKYSDPQLSVTQLGDELKLSPYYVSKLFKENQEMSVSDFIAKTRIEKAKEQLRETEMSIKAIAESNGFLSSNVFIRTFKKWEGITPGVYREQNSKLVKQEE